MAFRILSWNIETFGDTKRGAIENFVARVIQQYNADLVFILEGTVYAQGDVASGIARQLKAMTKGQGQEWVPFGSDPTGKSFDLPPLLEAANFPRVCELDAYRRFLLPCYTEPTPGSFTLKPPNQITSKDRAEAIEKLELAGVRRRDLETYIGLFRRDPALWLSNHASVALGSWVALSQGTGELISVNPQGLDIGYGDPQSEFNGRRPYRANVYFAAPWNPATIEKSFPVVAFHAPFGTSEKPRIKANVGLLNLATFTPNGTPIRLCEQPAAVVCGDFNIRYDWTADFSGLTLPVDASLDSNKQTYGSFYAAGFQMTIQELTSLKALNQDLWNVTNPIEFRSSAYDNVMVRTAGPPITHANARVIDLISDVYGATKGQGNYLTNCVPTSPSWYNAFEFVRNNVSDHLPVLCELTVPARP